MNNSADIRKKMNRLGSKGLPFVFLIDFLMENPQIFLFDDPSGTIKWKIQSPYKTDTSRQMPHLKRWNINPVSYETYRKGFDLVQKHILSGDTYLLNYTQLTPIDTNLTLDEIFQISVAPYKILLKNKFVCFSPESFVKISGGKISSFPMKGTIDADCHDAEKLLLSDSKELAEHSTITDLIRNDISMVAGNVTVEKFRYLERIHTNRKDLLQVSSEITGDLPLNYPEIIGDIILEAENYNRGYYTGVFGIFNGKNLDSCVLIRFIENQKGQLVYKSGGGITFMSRPEAEYQELINKIYVPIS